MKTKIKKYWQLFWYFRKLQLMRQLEYRTDFIFWGFVSLMWSGFTFFFFSLIVRVSGNIGGWNEYQIYLLISVFTILDAFTWSFFYHNMRYYTNYVFSGDLSQFLTKPIDTQFLMMTQNNTYNNIFRLIMGIVMLLWSINKLQLEISLLSFVWFFYTFIVAMLFVYFLWFCISTLSFYVEKLDNINDIIPSLRQMWQVPEEVYTGFFSVLFRFIIPLGLITSIPTKILLGQQPWVSTIYLSVFTVLMMIISRIFFKFSLRKYGSVGN